MSREQLLSLTHDARKLFDSSHVSQNASIRHRANCNRNVDFLISSIPYPSVLDISNDATTNLSDHDPLVVEFPCQPKSHDVVILNRNFNFHSSCLALKAA